MLIAWVGRVVISVWACNETEDGIGWEDQDKGGERGGSVV
jgi:hypothetical protein